MQQNLSAPLTDDELDKLESMLASFPDSMNLEMLDGFFAALVCSPELVMPSTYIPHILGTDESQFADLEEVKEFYGLIVRHWNAVARSLHDDELYDLVVIDYEDDEPYGNAWALGFMLGFKIGGEAWEDLLEDEQHGRLLIPILALAHEHDPDPEMRPPLKTTGVSLYKLPPRQSQPEDCYFQPDSFSQAAISAGCVFSH